MSWTPNSDEDGGAGITTAAGSKLPKRFAKSAKTSREALRSPLQEVKRPSTTSEGRNPPLSLWRDSQTIQAYLGGQIPITKLPSPQSWATRTAVSCALTKSTPPPVSATPPVVGSRNYSISEKHETSPSSDHHHYEDIMELKRQLVQTNQDLHLTKISRSLSTGNGNAAVMAMISPTSGDIPGAPGSPYRASSGTALNSAPKPSLSKELMQKLRSMTETIKMLSDENAQLRTQNEEILRSKSDKRKSNNGNSLYDDLDKTQLVDLVMSYDEKLKALSTEVLELQKKLKAADEATKEVEAATQTSKSAAEKDKYKQLARRLKEERNNFRDNLESKQKEQADLKVEMEKMSELISDLRSNCQTLQHELSEVRAISKDRIDVAIQANVDNSRPSTRRLSNSSITQESIRKARSVYGAKQPKPRNNQISNGNHQNGSLTSLASLKEAEQNKLNKKFDRSVSVSPSKPPTTMNNGGARIAKPVSRNQAKTIKPQQATLPTKLPVSPASSISSHSPRHTPSRIPQPESSSPRKSRIPSAPKYHTPNRTFIKPSPAKSSSTTTVPNASSRRSVTPSSSSQKYAKDNHSQSPPPPPPPTQMTHVNEEDNGINTSPRMITSEEVRSVEATPTPSPQPPTPSPKPPTPEPTTTTTNHKIEDDKAEVSDSDDHEESDEEILRVTADGRVEMTPSSRGQSQLESPIVPSVIENKFNDSAMSHNSSGSEENPSADDEGSRDGDCSPTSKPTSETSNNSVDCTPKTRKKVEHFRQGLAARRIQRTWKHFYEELEERKDVKNELPATLVQVIEEKAKLESGASSSSTSSSPTKTEIEQLPKLSATTSDEEKLQAVETIEDAFVDHQRRERALAGLKAKIHTARPWQKKKTTSSNAADVEVVEESSEEELERAYRALHQRGNDIRAKVSIIKVDQDLFTSGKVNEMKARLAERRSKINSERSDGITEDDDDEDVVY